MALTDTQVKKAKADGKPVKLSDGGGLYLQVNPTGAKLWRYAYRFAKKQKLMALGTYPEVSLAQARERHAEARRLLANSVDPMEQRKADRYAQAVAAENSFETFARQWWEQWRSARSDNHAQYVIRRLEQNVFPLIGARPVGAIEAPELVAMVKAVAARGALDIAKRCLQMCSHVFRYAIAHGMASRNPAADIKPSDILPSRRKENYARVDARELPQLLLKIEAYQGKPTTRLAMQLMAYTFVRTKELIGARWSEFDLEAARWDVPAERMKMRTPHIVPLSPQAVNVLRILHTITGGNELLFPGERDHSKPMSNNTILAALDRLGYKGRMTGHGFRGLASTILHEQGFDHAHIELQLAHIERKSVSSAYNHALYLPQRAAMMQWWGEFLESVARGNATPTLRLVA